MTKETCGKIWDTLVLPAFQQMQHTDGGLLCPKCEQEEFKTYYDEIIRHAKEHYMLDSSGVLNRHKVVAAIMIAILKTKPIKKVDAMYYKENDEGKLVYWPFNESLAITVALSILRAFILLRVKCAFSGKKVSRTIFEDAVKEDEEIFKDEVPITVKEREDWEWELYQVRQEGAYNLLSIAHIMKEIEKNCRCEYFLKNKDKNPTYPDSKNLVDGPVKMLTLDDLFK